MKGAETDVLGLCGTGRSQYGLVGVHAVLAYFAPLFLFYDQITHLYTSISIGHDVTQYEPKKRNAISVSHFETNKTIPKQGRSPRRIESKL